eukprot:TRINITY_DN12017_c0_g1_i1.p1 TRINITY_DN12017_c0_g1~~TRINITY_DN12017_c0_g1_i1.p1  ORF type:complete len:294 (+),score=26.25 TRINITY_DN12017_c0_g1_i1:42-923(+)
MLHIYICRSPRFVLCPAIQKRKFTSFLKNFDDEITYAQIRSGKTVPLPRATTHPLDPNKIALHGEEALDIYFEPDTPQNIQANKNQNIYKRLRPQLSLTHFGRWVAISELGCFIGNTEKQVRNVARLAFPDDCHISCIGCEILLAGYMDTTQKSENLQFEEALPKGKFSGIFEDHFLVRSKYSFDGKNFIETVMKYDPGATLIGAPREVLLNPPAGVLLDRGPDIYYYTHSGQPIKARSYNENYIEVAGLLTKTTFVESRVWLLGYPVISRFINTLNIKAKEPVVMQPLPGET